MRKLTYILAAAVLLGGLTGCQQEQKENAGKIDAQTGLRLSCVVEFLRSDGSRYLTEQKCEVSANPKAIKLTAKEPFGEIAWSVKNGAYSVQKPLPSKVFDKDLYSLMMDKDIAAGLLELYLAGLREPASKAGKEILKFQGQVYEPAAKIGRVNLYRNQRSGKLDLVTSGSDKLYLISGFNYQKTKGQKGFYPSKIDIYSYRSDFDKELLAQMSCFLE
ncbi:MAG: hypothetical protein CVV39_01760 [Planctomycetes bacterium HGW-Planctomycetes-1]|nr:MAG: hypothetical protein CVV39_01760 [Planctomycetes bacterium HGW-Planctomycetes-1]